jgi:hypothetical protein
MCRQQVCDKRTGPRWESWKKSDAETGSAGSVGWQCRLTVFPGDMVDYYSGQGEQRGARCVAGNECVGVM